MNILVISSRFPYPPLKGDKVRAYYPIKLLSKKHNIDLISFSESPVVHNQMSEMKKYCNKIDIVYINKVYFYLLLVLGIATPFPSQVLCYYSSRMKKIINDRTCNQKYDIVYIVCGRLSGYCFYVNSTPVIVDWIDALSMSTERLFNQSKLNPKKFLYYLEWKKMRRFELANLNKKNLYSIITTNVDKKYLDNRPDSVLPNGVDTRIFYPQLSESEKDIDLIFTGNMGYLPNIHAVTFFYEKILPLIVSNKPDVTLYIVGINPSGAIKKMHNNRNVIVTGFVTDISLLLNRSKIFIAPLQSGAGIQNKILEAMACQLPVITTKYGNAGIQGQDNVDILERNDPHEFAGAVMELLKNRKLRLKIGQKGEQLVKSKFSWENFTNQLEGIFKELISK